ncbi:NAD(+) synthase [Ureaplasma miroungigenitalium]|uniref:NH(3)-dependent NAD(+) synthetase n=1 Tax=Ureaplasma miroungigenitalium TaxID=1042321 RepID=A0ABT3BM33_9BACT|nr:NAD(+) synthase [Ureaplasma miroungigenitalium]MCV3728294.1 NAD(+) synthase [Ureaplasma miroungigenitalium]MCV3734099.1 NAD(+) synthase [Ureaplasma miroungigenitalium]
MCTRLKSYLRKLLLHLENYLTTNNIKTVVLGVSGGIDSTLALYLLKQIKTPLKIMPVFIDIDSKPQDKADVVFLQSIFPEIQLVNLKPILQAYQAHLTDLNNPKLVYDNLKTRIRANYLYALANEHEGIVISTLNFNEYHLGFFTKFGDSNADYHLLIGLLKSQIYKIADFLKIDQRFINKKPSPGFDEQTDEDLLGFSYEEYEQVVLQHKRMKADCLKKVNQLVKKNQHKHFAIDEYLLNEKVQSIYEQWK